MAIESKENEWAASSDNSSNEEREEEKKWIFARARAHIYSYTFENPII